MLKKVKTNKKESRNPKRLRDSYVNNREGEAPRAVSR